MDNVMKYKDYWAKIKYSDEDSCFWGEIEGLKDNLILFEGNTVENLRKDFENSIDEYLALCKRNNINPEKQYKGSFNIRIEPAIHKEAVKFSKILNVSLNQFVETAIKDKLLSLR